MHVDSPWNPTTVAINGNDLPPELVEVLDSGQWMDLSGAAGRLINERFGTRTLYPDLYDYAQIVRATDWFASDAAAGYWPGGLDRSLDMRPDNSVLIGDLVGAGEDLLALDHRSTPPCVRFLTDPGWVKVADSISEFLEQLEAVRLT